MNKVAGHTPHGREIGSELVFVVYDPRNGNIVHVHRALTLGGSEGPSPAEEESQALELARQFGHRIDGLRVLQVSPDGPDPGVALRVDVDRHRLVTDEPTSA